MRSRSRLRARALADRRGMEEGVRRFLTAARGGPLAGDLARTPRRVAQAWGRDLLAGYREDPARILVPLREGKGRDVVAVRDVEFVSTCVHHLLPFHGKVHLAYRPRDRIVGVSRLARLVRCLSRRLQLQESLTREIAEALASHLRARGAACVVEASHLCMMARGGRGGAGTVMTSAFTGAFEEDPRERAHVLALLGFSPDRASRREGRGRASPRRRGKGPARRRRSLRRG